MPNSLVRTLCLVGCTAVLAGCMSTRDTVTRNVTGGLPEGRAFESEIILAAARGGSIQAYVTGYSFWDNTPPGSARIAHPVIHREAGGTGTYGDPITVAVGHTKRGGRNRMDFPAGTRFYFPNLQKYGIVEDLCGDGPRPQDGPCYSGYGGLAWLDIYVGGRSVGSAASDKCMRSITGVQDVIVNPAPGMPVRPGEIALSTCRAI